MNQEDPASRILRELANTEPDGTALEVGAEVVTWAGLDAEADAVAAVLLDAGLAAGTCVGVRLPGYRTMLATSLGVSRAGLVLVPLDPGLPEERLAQVLTESQVGLVLSHEPVPDGLPVLGPQAWLGAQRRTGVRRPRPEGAPASVIFTSGSTGVPKGIAQSAEQVRMASELLDGLGTGHRLAGFDMGSVGNYATIVSAAINTRSTVVAYDIRSLGLAHLHTWIAERGITALGVVPTLLAFWLPCLPDGWVLEPLRTVVSFGEQLMWPQAAALRAALPEDCTFVSAYGQSETTGITRFEVVSGQTFAEGRVPAGRVNPGLTVTVVDPAGNELPYGQAGEIHVRSAANALGYWHRPDLTEATFVEHADGTRTVRTGDAGRLDADGTLHHLGRLDDVVKISGHRVELGDVSAALRAIAGVDDVVTLGVEDPVAGLRLRSHVVLVPGADTSGARLRELLLLRLPGYMIPDSVAVHEVFPRLPNGKVDRRALAAHVALEPAAVAAPRTLVEALTQLWAELLDLPTADPDTDFFACGGDSLRAARLFTEIERRLGHDQPLTTLIAAPTPALLARALTDGARREVLVPGRTSGTLPPLFVVHGGKGDLLFLRDLSDGLPEDQPVYGLLAPALDGLAPTEQSIEELAARYLAEARKVWRGGPLHLFGYSLGGLIAFEMARQVLAAGEQLGLLILGDTGNPNIEEPSDERGARARLRQIRSAPRREAVGLAGKLADNQVRHLVGRVRDRGWAERWEQAVADSAHGKPVPVAQRGDFVFLVYGLLARRYRPEPLAASAVLLRTGYPAEGETWGWSHVTEDVRTVDLSATHYSMVHGQVAELAAVLTAELETHRARLLSV